MSVDVVSHSAIVEDFRLVEFPKSGMIMEVVRYRCSDPDCTKVHAGMELTITDPMTGTEQARAVIGYADIDSFYRNLGEGIIEMLNLRDVLIRIQDKEIQS